MRDNEVEAETLLQFIRSRIPPSTLQLPALKYNDSKRKCGIYTRRCNRAWFEAFDFLTYSEEREGLFCLPCILFPSRTWHTGASRAKILIEEPLTNWKDALADLRAHGSLHYHLDSKAKMEAFVSSMKNPESRLDLSLTTARQERVEQNMQVLTSIVKCLELCGRQGIALRGHRDDSTSQELNQGNFKVIVDFRIDAGDDVLKKHVETSSKRATYLSKTSQNQLLDCMGEAILEAIVEDVKAGTFYSVLADEVSDVSGWEQLGIALRYVKDCEAHEKLVGFVACTSVTGEAVCSELVSLLGRLGLHTNHCRGQSYDGAGSMSGRIRGCQAKFKEVAQHATYYHCASHQLNLALSKSASVVEVSNMVHTLQTLGLFFKYSPKRQRALERAIVSTNQSRKENGEPVIVQSKFKVLCDTRWVERHTSMDSFAELYPALISCLETISRNESHEWDQKAIMEASGVLKTITSSGFIAAFHTNMYFFGFTKALSVQLQGTTEDILTAYGDIALVRETLEKEREDVVQAFKEPFQEMEKMAKLSGSENGLAIPRRCIRQTQRSNLPADTVEEYWRRTVFIPYLDHLLTELSSRFSQLAKSALQGMLLLPKQVGKITPNNVDELLSAYEHDLPSAASFKQEVKLWCNMWQHEKESSLILPQNLPETCRETSPNRFPNIARVLPLLMVAPVTTATVERGNSALRYLKTELQSTMGEARLNVLTFLFLHKDIPLDIRNVVQKFASKHPRRMLLVDPVGTD